jgi:serine acetyltransferase
VLTLHRLDMYRVKTMLWNEGRSTLTKFAIRVLDRLVGPP